MKQKILNIIQEAAKKQNLEIRLDESNLAIDFRNLGLDSINVLGIIVAIEDSLGLKLDDFQLTKIKTVNQLIAAFEALESK